MFHVTESFPHRTPVPYAHGRGFLQGHKGFAALGSQLEWGGFLRAPDASQ